MSTLNGRWSADSQPAACISQQRMDLLLTKDHAVPPTLEILPVEPAREGLFTYTSLDWQDPFLGSDEVQVANDPRAGDDCSLTAKTGLDNVDGGGQVHAESFSKKKNRREEKKGEERRMETWS